MNATDERLECPTAEQLAAFIADGFDARERQIVVAHLAICDACRKVVVDVLQFQEAEPA